MGYLAFIRMNISLDIALNSILQTDADFLNDLKNDDNEAFEKLYRKYWQRLYDFALVKTHDGNASEELIQDLFVTLWEKRKTLQINHLESYLFKSVKHRVVDYYKQKIFEELDSIEAPATTAPYPLFLEELESALNEAVAQLPPKTQEIFRLNRFEGKTARQIAEKLQLPERTVEYHITQALRVLKIRLKDFLPFSLLFFF